MMEEIMYNTRFDDYKRLKEIIARIKSRLEASLMGQGHSIAMLECCAQFSESAYYSDILRGYKYYEFIKKLDEEFDLAIIGKKGKWYDHKVSVTDVQEQTEEEKKAVEIGEEEKSEDADTTTDAAAEEENKD